ncbi:hypothetical protein NX059_001873 [Plenodomus lindquistii]|nr:hypothetical protein NX059_001873 [Plenodomus lindquistii]
MQQLNRYRSCGRRHWYHAAQERHYEYPDASPTQCENNIEEEDEGDGLESAEERTLSSGEGGHKAATTTTTAQENARKALRREELTALFACFVGPLLGAALLHTLRGQLTRTEGIVSDFNLLIFVLFSEYRPIKQVIKLRDERIWHLQRIVKADPQEQQTIQQLAQRVAELEARLDAPLPTNIDISDISSRVTEKTQLQLDALTRAVRRYEKRQVTETMQIEARFRETEIRLRDALSLAAAAARTGQQPGFITMAVRWAVGIITGAIATVTSIAFYPFRAFASSVAYIESMFIKDKRGSRKRNRVGNGKAYSPMSSSRIRSKSRQ